VDYTTLQTHVARSQLTAGEPAITFALQEAYRRIWFLHPQADSVRHWDFRRIGPAALTVAAGVETPTLDKDGANVVLAAEVVGVFDDNGCALERLHPDEFNRCFRQDFVQNNRDRPWAYKWENGVLTLGPRPDASYSFTYVYDRQVGFLAAGTTFTVGYMTAGSDTPAWDANHHQALVWMAREIAFEEQGNPYASTAHDQAGFALQSMEAALLRDQVPASQWPAYQPNVWGSYGDAYGC
jgi:hypothetical protein